MNSDPTNNTEGSSHGQIRTSSALKVSAAVDRFVVWLDRYGPISHDHQSYFAGPFGRRAKALYYQHRMLGTFAVAPMIFSEAFFPQARRLFGYRLRFPIADAHYAMGFARLADETGQEKYLDRARQFLEALNESRCPEYKNYCWGYPFDWVTRTGVMRAGTPLITTTPYVYEAFEDVYRIDGDERWLEVMESIAEHAFHDIPDRDVSAGSASAGYNPTDKVFGVVNASAYRAFLLSSASTCFRRKEYREVADRNLNFVLDCQQPDGSWPYAVDGARDFVDHFHTCFVLKALAKIERQRDDSRCVAAISAGVDYYVKNLFDEDGLPRPFSKAPRLTVYERELYDYAECFNLCSLLRGRFPSLDDRLRSALADLLDHWQKPDGSFRTRRLRFGWDNVPMHRWAQSQLFRALCMLMPTNKYSDGIVATAMDV